MAADGREGKASPAKQRQRRRGLWQPRFWEHTIEDDEDFSHHFDDVPYNPVKHGLVNRVRDWPCSSFHRWVRGERVSGRLGRRFDLRHERVNGAFDRRTVTPKVMHGRMTYRNIRLTPLDE